MINYLLKSCIQGYPNAVSEFGLHIQFQDQLIKLQDQSKLETLFFALAVHLNSSVGHSYLGNRYLLGDGIKKNVEKGAFHMFQSLSMGHRSQVRKMQLDNIYDLTNRFK